MATPLPYCNPTAKPRSTSPSGGFRLAATDSDADTMKDAAMELSGHVDAVV